MENRKLSKRQLLEYANSLPDDEPEDEGTAVHVVRVKKDDPKWAWLFGPGESGEESEDEGESEDEDEPKKDPAPKPRNKFFGGN